MTTTLTLPTVEELRAAFPAAWSVKQGHSAFHFLEFFMAEWKFILRWSDHDQCFYVIAKQRRRSANGYHPSDWRQCICDAVARGRAQLVEDAEEAQAAVAALDEAMKEATSA